MKQFNWNTKHLIKAAQQCFSEFSFGFIINFMDFVGNFNGNLRAKNNYK